tara:strand:- start:4333 stop:5229 length:897 start_codon:yes stop_codon:yes gene_type:complete
MNVLVTGAAGLVGYHLCRRLVTDGHRVIGTVHNTVNPALHTLNPDRFKVVKCDIRDQFAVNQVIKSNRVNTVFHLAACLPYSPVKDYAGVNVQGTANLLRAAQSNRVSSFIYTSSMSVYSTPPDSLPADETCSTYPSTEYGVTKLEGEQLCTGTDVPKRIAILRLAGVYGEHSEKERVINKFIHCALTNQPLSVDGDGRHSSDFVHVGDVVLGAYLAWQKRASGVFNIGSGQETTLKALANLIISLTGSKSKIELTRGTTDRPFTFYLDITKAYTTLGYSPTSLEEGLRLYIKERVTG